jgi:hypothetical protein
VKARIGMDDADIGHDRLSQDDRHIAPSQTGFERREVIKLNYPAALRPSHLFFQER